MVENRGLMKWVKYYYFELGLTPIPVAKNSKRPILKGWTRWCFERPDWETVESWFKGCDCNVGVVCGLTESGYYLVALDFDDPEIITKFFPKFEKLKRETLVINSRRGPKICFLTEEKIRKFKIPELKLEILGLGAQFLVPPSVHPKTGQPYTFLANPENGVMIVEGFYESIKKRAEQLGIKIDAFHLPEIKEVRLLKGIEEDPPCIKQAFKGVEIGFRNQTGFALARYFRLRGFKSGETLNLLLDWNKGNRPSLDEREVRSIVKSTYMHVYPVGCGSFLEINADWCDRKSCPFRREPIVLSHLNQIEDPKVAGKPVVVEAVVSSTSVAYLAPARMEAVATDKDGNQETRVIEIGERNPLNIKLVGVNEDVKYKRLKRFVNEGRVKIRELAWRTIYRVRVRPPVFTLERKGERIVDEHGFEYKAYDVYVASEKPVVFQPGSLIRVEGIALPNPKTQSTTLLAYKVEFPEEVQAYDVEKLKRLKEKFKPLTVKERLNWILDNFGKYSHIVGRRNLAKAGFLGFFTPEWVKLNGELQRGWANILICGDTTTAKSETLRKLLQLLGGGMLITAETASAVGLTGTATQIEKSGWFVDWGFLVLCDRKLLAIDGAHKLSARNWAALAEAERTGAVTIAKAAKNSAYARTRQVKIANPVNEEAGRYSTKSLAGFLYPCQALTTILDRTSIARLDLAVFADQRDVSPEEINVRFEDSYDEDLKLLSEALRWCWSGKTRVEFTDGAVKLILREATKLYNVFFAEAVPLVIDIKWKLARLSAALAFLTVSTEDFKTVEVTEDHVKEVVDFIREEYSKAGLNTFAQQTRFEVLDKEDVAEIIMRIKAALVKSAGDFEEEKIKQILRFIVVNGRFTRDELKTRFGLSENSEMRPLLAVLKGEGLIKVGRGFYAEAKLIQAYKVTEGFTDVSFNKINNLNNLREEGYEKIMRGKS